MNKLKKAQTINISPLRWGHAPEPTDMPFGVLSGVPDVITHAKFLVNRLRGFSSATTRKVPFPILFWTTLTTVLHYRADCDIVNRQIGVEESKYRVTGDLHLQVAKGSRDLLLKFWDPLHISGTVRARNAKFWMQIHHQGYCMTKEMQNWVKRGQEGVTWPSFDLLGSPPYLGNG